MKKFVFPFLLVVGVVSFAVRPAEPKDDPDPVLVQPDKKDEPKKEGEVKVVVTPDGKVKLLNRELMRFKAKNTRMMSRPKLKGIEGSIPTPPEKVDWTKANTVAYPTLGNDQVGDCYYVSMAHHHQTFGGALGKPVVFDKAALVNRYLKISGGDNGLSNYDIFGSNRNGEWYGGIVGPRGPHKILDHMVVDPENKDAIKLGMWLFGGVGYTCSLLSSWMNNIHPGAVWDTAGVADSWAGHAMLLNGYDLKGNYKCQTWGLNPPISLTHGGVLKSDPELYVVFSLDWFDPETGKCPNGLHYVEVASHWVTLGGNPLPPNPFPGPTPPPDPVPPTPIPPTPVPPTPVPPGTGFTGTLTYVNGVLTAVTPGGTTPLPATGVEADLKAAGVGPATIIAVLKLLADLTKSKQPREVILADIIAVILSLGL